MRALGHFLKTIDWLTLFLGWVLGLVYGWYLKGVLAPVLRPELKVSQLIAHAEVLVGRSGFRWRRMRVVAIERETVRFHVEALGMTVMAHRSGPEREQIVDDEGRPMRMYSFG